MARRGRGEVHTGFWWRSLKETGHLEDLGMDERTILKWILKTSRIVGYIWTGLIWLRIGTGRGLL